MSVSNDRLMQRSDILEEIRLIHCSNTDYISSSGNVYKERNKMFFKKKCNINKHNGYVYCGITQFDGKNKSMRVHKLVAMAFVENPRPDFYTIVGHSDNVKHNNNATNLYWTNNQENTKKAADDGLNPQPIGELNDSSMPIMVTDTEGNTIAVYGSMRECSRLITNLDISYLTKILPRNGEYKTRNKRYKYIKISKEEFECVSDKYKGLELEELEKCVKQIRVFKAINTSTGEEYISDNQKRFAIEHGLYQSDISNCLIKGNSINGWHFETIKNISYAESSSYENLISLSNKFKAENIKTGQILMFKTTRELKDHFGIEGHGTISAYVDSGHLIHSQWKVIAS